MMWCNIVTSREMTELQRLVSLICSRTQTDVTDGGSLLQYSARDQVCYWSLCRSEFLLVRWQTVNTHRSVVVSDRVSVRHGTCSH